MKSRRSGWNEFTRSQFRPFSGFLFETETANDIPFHLDVITAIADVDINGGFCCLESRCVSQMRLLVLLLDGMIRGAAIDVLAVYANTH
jgi:hypothetical protein